MRSALFISTALFLGWPALASELTYPKLSQEGWAELTQLHSQILELCAPPKCLTIFLGRSPTLLAAYREAQGIGGFISVPASGLTRLEGDQVLTAQKHFEQWVLRPELESHLTGVERVVVVDHVNGGKSLAYASGWIEEFTKTHGVKTEAASFGQAMSQPAAQWLEDHHVSLHVLQSSPGPGITGDFRYLTHHSQVEHYAELSSWNPLSETPPPPPARKLRRNNPYIEKPGESSKPFASYDDLVEWFKDPERKSKLPTRMDFYRDCGIQNQLSRFL